MRARSPASRGREALALLGLTGAVGLAFLDKPFHVDDAFFLRVTLNVAANPLDPWAGEIDWWDRPLPIFELDSNPPLLNYYLAPFAAAFGPCEIALHAAMLPFVLLLAFASLWLGRRFCRSPWSVCLLVMTSPVLAASVNAMRDVPAAALATASVALFAAGVDADDRRRLAAGAGLAGLALLTKYSAALVLPLLGLYALLAGRPRRLGWLLLPAGLFALFCLHGVLVYGEPHLAAQLARTYGRPGLAWRDNLAGLPAAAGSACFLLPALLWAAARRPDGWLLGALAALALASALAVQSYLGEPADAEHLLFLLSGAALLGACAAEGLRGARRAPGPAGGRDSVFLAAWLGAVALASVAFVPFQAVRHLLPALPPLALLGLRSLEAGGQSGERARRALVPGLIALQACTALAVARADAELARAYRDFAVRAGERAAASGVGGWYLGHWGWMLYAERAGLRPLQTTGPAPQPGELLFVPRFVDKGAVLERRPALRARLRLVGQVAVPGASPFRTVHEAGAGFYAQRSRRPGGGRPDLPYRWLPGAPLEIFEIYEVR